MLQYKMCAIQEVQSYIIHDIIITEAAMWRISAMNHQTISSNAAIQEVQAHSVVW